MKKRLCTRLSLVIAIYLFFIYAGGLLIANPALGASGRYLPRNTASDDYWHFHNVGNLGLTITNFGILGQGYNNPDQPSCWYKLRTSLQQEQVEHFSYAGIWIGGMKQGRKYVSTGIYDGVFDYNDGGWEFTSSATDQVHFNKVFHHVNKIDRRFDFSRLDSDSVIVFGGALNAPIEDGIIQFGTTNWDSIITRSTIYDASGDPESNPYAQYAMFFDPDAISHQDLICAYTDTNSIVPGTGIAIPNHDSLRVHVYQEAYAWFHSFADAFSILNYTVTNIPESGTIALTDTTVEYPFGSDILEIHYSAGDTIWHGQVIEDAVFGIWVDSSVGNMNYTTDYNNNAPGGRWNWYDNLNNFDQERNLGMQYDLDGDAGWAQSYLGVKILGTEPLGEEIDVYYNQWTWRGSNFSGDWPMPPDEEARYDRMLTHGNYANIPGDDSGMEQSWMILLTCGPFPPLAPGQRFNVSMAIVCGQWEGSGPDSEERRDNLYRNAEWAQIAYNGEDNNGNGILDAGEDKDGDGKITRYILPEAPPPPQLVVVPGDQEITLYWNKLSEAAVDPVSAQKDFEGYRIYGAPKTEGIAGEWTLLADFDIDYIMDPSYSELVGYNTGFEAIRVHDPDHPEIDSIEINDTWVHYSWTNYGVMNGWPRELYYSVVAYDRGDPNNNLPSFESPLNANRTYAFPGTTPAEPDDDRIGVYPNPYKGRASWDGTTARDRLIWFRHLPPRCEITIFNLAGEKIDRFVHTASSYTGEDVQRVTRGSSPGERRVFAGGEHAWDLLSEDDQEIATGLYIYTVENLDNGKVKTGKFLVIK